jgi:mRNA-degrading endonuclease YafQ of YafQ-DinJ toxin-antitoxin module|tara:strand:- start:60 stop:254 length:195 start_codon:yes stop_codon:yes gene_type:complete
MKKKKDLYKFIKKELADLNRMLEHINELEEDIFKEIALHKTRQEYFEKYIKPLMLIYKASKNKK